ncbi:hypothetical protein DRP53_01470 [candidate division WOR-3 bacterium]|uniref:LPS-assembly protein LptD central domain-containing protein n=1 Tax=candidate division WOR-3 bacterium TaxID=2052148 RepID=A0A660SL09_UNCW3|nr:MAG: hypothetical protein DRP53_01470 [candidate division WOR-3 bacterium]
MFLLLLFLADTTMIRYRAQKIIYNFKDSTITLIDSAQISYGDLNLYADTCRYYLNQNLLISFPRSTIVQEGESLVGGTCRYNTDTHTGMIEKGRATVEKGYLYGDEIWLVGKHQFNVKNGRYTTCDHDPPHYYFYAPRMKVYLDDIAVGEPVILMVRFLPTLAAPFWFVPISKKRKSGLLPFRAGRSKTEGEYIKDFSYYLVINDYADATFTTDIMRKKGVRPRLNLIYRLPPFSVGNWDLSYIHETDTRSKRYSINGYNRSDRFLFKSQLLAQIDYQSDETYIQEYAEEKPLLLKRELYSHLTISREILHTQNTLSLDRRVDYDRMTTTDHIPHYHLAFPTFNLLNVTTTPSFSFKRERRGDTTGSVANLVSPFSTTVPLGFLTYHPGINLDYAVFDRDTSGNQFPSRFGYTTSHELSTTLYRLFPLSLFGLDGLLHRVVPKLGYRYSPEVTNPPVLISCGVGGFTKQSQIFFQVDNYFETKYQNGRIPLFNLRGRVGYNLLNDSLTEIPITLSSNPNKNIGLSSSFIINPYTLQITRSFSEEVRLATILFTLTLGHTYSDLSHQLWSSFTPARFLGIDLTLSSRYDFNLGTIVEYSASLTKDLHCWEFLFNYSNLGGLWRYDFKLRIKKIPEVEFGKGLLGILPE